MNTNSNCALTGTYQYFRQGRKRANISHDTRCLPKSMGGLSQLNTHKQIELLRAKWVTKSLAGSDHLWLVYWTDNVNRLQEQLGLHCSPLCANANWSKLRVSTSPNSDVFPMVFAAYKAWHASGLTATIDTFTSLSAHPLFNNKFVPLSLLSDPPSPITPHPDSLRLLSHLNHILIAELFIEADPPPTIAYHPNIPAGL